MADYMRGVKRRKVTEGPNQHHRDYTPVYDVEINGQVVARVAMTGVSGRDNYPWAWHLTVETPKGWRWRSQGETESLRDAVDTIAARWWQAHQPNALLEADHG